MLEKSGNESCVFACVSQRFHFQFSCTVAIFNRQSLVSRMSVTQPNKKKNKNNNNNSGDEEEQEETTKLFIIVYGSVSLMLI